MPGRPAIEIVEVVHISKDFLLRLVDDRSPFHMDLRREHKTNSGNDQQEDRDGDQNAFEDFHDGVANKVEGDNVVIFSEIQYNLPCQRVLSCPIVTLVLILKDIPLSSSSINFSPVANLS